VILERWSMGEVFEKTPPREEVAADVAGQAAKGNAAG
jgi:hypothetical protein